MTSPSPVPVPNRQHKKSRDGCKQCKERKVKCDEQRPLCSNCAKHFRNIKQCDFSPLFVHDTAFKEHVTAPRPKRPAKKRPNPRDEGISRGPGSQLDPFHSCPGSNVPNAQLFMHHYFSNFTSKSFPMVLGYKEKPFLQTWWSMAAHDDVLFHATLQLSAFDLESLHGKGDAPVPKRLLNECIVRLRERIEDPVQGISDETIGSVLVLAIVEFERGNLKMVKMHIEGLKRMVTMRGGLDAIRDTNPMLTNLIFGITTTVMTEPQFFSEVEWECLEDLPEFACSPHLFNYEDVYVSSTVARAIRELRVMTNNFTNRIAVDWPAKPTPQSCSQVIIRLLSIRVPPEEGPLVESVSESLRLCTIMLCFLPFKNDYPSPELMINVQLHRLKANLEIMLEVGPPNHPLLPWILMSGGVFSQQPERGWFIGQLLAIAPEMGIESWADLLPHLKNVIWIEYFCEPPFQELWAEVVAKRNELDAVDFDLW